MDAVMGWYSSRPRWARLLMLPLLPVAGIVYGLVVMLMLLGLVTGVVLVACYAMSAIEWAWTGEWKEP
jgi:hypothetical protein